MGIQIPIRGIPLVIEDTGDGAALKLTVNAGTPIYITSGGVLSASSISAGTTITTTSSATEKLGGVTITATTVSGTTVKSTSTTATNVSATTAKATTVTATTFSGTNAAVTECTGTVLCGAAGATRFVFTQGGSATIGAQVTSAHAFLEVYNGANKRYVPVFTSITTS